MSGTKIKKYVLREQIKAELQAGGLVEAPVCSADLEGAFTMIIVNTETVPGKDITALHGLVQGNTIRAKHVGRDIGAALKNLVGGELTAYTELLTEARREAMSRMIAQAEALGANAVVNVRFTTSSVAGGAAELYSYGTAVTVT